MADTANRTPAGQETLVEVEFTVLGNTDLDRFDILLDKFLDDEAGEDDLREFSDMVVYARRVDGKD